jgi:hypothetical protein
LVAQNLLTNPGFDEGTATPAGWQLADGAGEWSRNAQAGGRAVLVQGNGQDQSYWRSAQVRLTPGGLYRFQFLGRRESDASGGTAVSGVSQVNRDFPLDASWRLYRFVFAAPSDGAVELVRLGQWHVQGRLSFDEADLAPVLVAHARLPSGVELGEGESIRRGVYRFRPDFNWQGANFHRPLATNRAGFNSNRWLFSPGAEVVYWHAIAGATQRSARVRASINHHVGGTLRLEARGSGQAWALVAEFDGQRRGEFVELPATLFAATEVWVRLSQAGGGAGFQVDAYEYEAPLAEAQPEAEGASYFVDVTASDPSLAVGLRALRAPDGAGGCRLELNLTNQSTRPLHARAHLVSPPGTSPARRGPNLRLPAGGSSVLSLTCPLERPGDHLLQAMIRDQSGRALFTGQTSARLSFLDDAGFGYLLSGEPGVELWWCESGWKVGRQRALPRQPTEAWAKSVTVSAARGEYEAAQVVLRPDTDCTLVAAQVGRLKDAAGEPAPISVRMDEVAYVRVTHPTDSSCLPGWYPDPLPALRTPLALRAGQNQPLWLTFHVAPEAKPGEHRGKLRLQTSRGKIVVPLTVRVFDFVLPRETHLKSALGLGAGAINRYHRLTNPQQRQAVFENYLRNFAEHRISPYSFYDYAPIEVRFTGEGSNMQARVEFSRFDLAAAKWLDEYRFNTFQLPLQGMGGGTFHSRHLGALAGFTEGAPEHARLFQDYLSQVERHLRERGWLNQAFTYWFDEPDPKDYDFVVEGMKRLKAAAPGIKRLLTEQPEPALLGHVDVWCGLTSEWTPEKVRARRVAGEEVWWYICTGPKAPYLTEFIDHPGNELRLWPWQSWQYGVTGLLIWATVYWTSPCAFPEPNLQDPWVDPMSYVSGYGLPVGHVGFWGNGDGRFLYPPRRDPNSAKSPNHDDPVNSLRWEHLRDGMEDYEYLWLLEQAVQRASAAGGKDPLVQAARGLLKVPASLSADLTHFNTDPRVLLAHRESIAKLIEQLTRAE